MKFHIHPFLTTISIYHTTAYTVLVPGKRALCSTRTSSLERTSIWSMFSDTHTHTHVFFGWQENSSLRIITAPTWRMWCESQALLWFLCPNDKTKKVHKHYIYIYIFIKTTAHPILIFTPHHDSIETCFLSLDSSLNWINTRMEYVIMKWTICDGELLTP